jgi:hypothetical protein
MDRVLNYHNNKFTEETVKIFSQSFPGSPRRLMAAVQVIAEPFDSGIHREEEFLESSAPWW